MEQTKKIFLTKFDPIEIQKNRGPLTDNDQSFLSDLLPKNFYPEQNLFLRIVLASASGQFVRSVQQNKDQLNEMFGFIIKIILLRFDKLSENDNNKVNKELKTQNDQNIENEYNKKFSGNIDNISNTPAIIKETRHNQVIENRSDQINNEIKMNKINENKVNIISETKVNNISETKANQFSEKRKIYTMNKNNDVVNIIDEEDINKKYIINPPTNILLNQIKNRIQSKSIKQTLPDKLKNTTACQCKAGGPLNWCQTLDLEQLKIKTPIDWNNDKGPIYGVSLQTNKETNEKFWYCNVPKSTMRHEVKKQMFTIDKNLSFADAKYKAFVGRLEILLKHNVLTCEKEDIYNFAKKYQK